MSNFFQDVDLKNNIFACMCLYCYKRRFRKFYRFKDDLLASGYLSCLEQKEEIDKFNNSVYETLVIYRIVRNGMRSFVRNFIYQNTILAEDYKLVDSNRNAFDNFMELSIVYNDYLFIDLRDLFIDFVNQNYAFYKDLFIDIYLLGLTPFSLRGKYHLRMEKINELLEDFKSNFANYLLSVGFIDSTDYLLSKRKVNGNCEAVTYHRRKQAKEETESYFSLYQNDFFVYKLLRKEKNLKPFADLLCITVEDLEKVIFHKTSSKVKLWLYQIQLIRKNFFKQYSLSELLSCDR